MIRYSEYLEAERDHRVQGKSEGGAHGEKCQWEGRSESFRNVYKRHTVVLS